jgi:RNA polymerase-binding protein DksA
MANKEQLKAELQARLAELGAKVDEVSHELRTAHSADWEERAIESEGDEVLEALENSALAEIQQIQRTLGKIDDGTYGACITCGSDIDQKRLEALPYATQCISCARDSG